MGLDNPTNSRPIIERICEFRFSDDLEREFSKLWDDISIVRWQKKESLRVEIFRKAVGEDQNLYIGCHNDDFKRLYNILLGHKNRGSWQDFHDKYVRKEIRRQQRNVLDTLTQAFLSRLSIDFREQLDEAGIRIVSDESEMKGVLSDSEEAFRILEDNLRSRYKQLLIDIAGRHRLDNNSLDPIMYELVLREFAGIKSGVGIKYTHRHFAHVDKVKKDEGCTTKEAIEKTYEIFFRGRGEDKFDSFRGAYYDSKRDQKKRKRGEP